MTTFSAIEKRAPCDNACRDQWSVDVHHWGFPLFRIEYLARIS